MEEAFAQATGCQTQAAGCQTAEVTASPAIALPTGDEALALMASRHSVRCFTDEPLSADEVRALQEAVEVCNRASGLSIRLVTNEPDAFRCLTAHYGKFRGVSNYLIMAGAPGADAPTSSRQAAPAATPVAPAATTSSDASIPSADLEERVGYWGQRLVLLAQSMGLRTCWVALTFAKRKVKETLPDGVEMPCVIALGHGVSDGKAHKSKAAEKVSNLTSDSPAWFARGVQAALLAPTAINQQSFFLELLSDETDDGTSPRGAKATGETAKAQDCETGDRLASAKPRVRATYKGGPYSGIDIGIIKHDFQLAAGADNFTWE